MIYGRRIENLVSNFLNIRLSRIECEFRGFFGQDMLTIFRLLGQELIRIIKNILL